MIFKSIVSMILFTGMLLATSGFGTELKVMTEDYPPYQFKKNGKAAGLAIDVYAEMIKQPSLAKYNLTVDKVQFLPWARSYKEVQKNKNSALFTMTLTDERKKLFNFVHPMAKSRYVVFSRKDSKIKISKKEDLYNFSHGVVRDDVGEQLIRSMGVPDGKIQKVTKAKQNVDKLVRGRIDLIPYGDKTGRYVLSQRGENPDDYEEVFTLKEGEMGIAFHKEADPQIVKDFQAALDAVIKSGKYAEIAARY